MPWEKTQSTGERFLIQRSRNRSRLKYSLTSKILRSNNSTFYNKASLPEHREQAATRLSRYLLENNTLSEERVLFANIHDKYLFKKTLSALIQKWTSCLFFGQALID